MNIQIITSSYPSFPGDPTASAGLFVNAFALELNRQGHRVIVQPIARKEAYTADPGLIMEPIPWKGGDIVLAQMDLFSIKHLSTIIHFFRSAKENCLAVHRKYAIDHTMCMWAIPCGIIGRWINQEFNKSY